MDAGQCPKEGKISDGQAKQNSISRDSKFIITFGNNSV